MVYVSVRVQTASLLVMSLDVELVKVQLDGLVSEGFKGVEAIGGKRVQSAEIRAIKMALAGGGAGRRLLPAIEYKMTACNSKKSLINSRSVDPGSKRYTERCVTKAICTLIILFICRSPYT